MKNPLRALRRVRRTVSEIRTTLHEILLLLAALGLLATAAVAPEPELPKPAPEPIRFEQPHPTAAEPDWSNACVPEEPKICICPPADAQQCREPRMTQ